MSTSSVDLRYANYDLRTTIAGDGYGSFEQACAVNVPTGRRPVRQPLVKASQTGSNQIKALMERHRGTEAMAQEASASLNALVADHALRMGTIRAPGHGQSLSEWRPARIIVDIFIKNRSATLDNQNDDETPAISHDFQ